MGRPLTILYEDNHLLAVQKPAGLLAMGDRTGEPTLVEAAKAYLKEKYRKPGDVFLGVVHRLDRPVAGVMVFARTSKAASRLSEQFRNHTVEKVYLAWVEGRVSPPTGTLVHWLRKNHDTNQVTAVAAHSTEAQECRLSYRRMTATGSRTLLEIRPETGRSHQIRVQLATSGWPILGDRKYGSKSSWPDGIALLAKAITVIHPTKKLSLTLETPLPEAWKH